MKRSIVKELPVVPNAPVPTKNADCYKFFGVEDCDGTRGFIIRENYDSDKYHVVITEQMTYGNNLWRLANECVYFHDYLAYVLDQEAQVYQFDKMSELALWLEEAD